MTDEYASGEYRYWHSSVPSPDLVAAVEEGWIPIPGRVLDVGCGAGTEAGFLGGSGATVVGADVSFHALRLAKTAPGSARFVQADALRLPFAAATFGAAIDRGFFHSLSPSDRRAYEAELVRVLSPGGRFLLRASLRSHGVRNDVHEDHILSTFAAWRIESMERRAIPADERTLEALVVRMHTP